MLRRRDWLMIQERLRQGVYVKDIAAELGVHPRTVSRARKRGDAPLRQRPLARQSKLDRYKPEIDRLLAAGVWNAAVILREIQAQGYQGQASILRDYIRPKRPLRQAPRRSGAGRRATCSLIYSMSLGACRAISVTTISKQISTA